MEIPYGYCQCGCGEKTPIATRNFHDRGIVKDKPMKYINHHGGRGEHWKQRIGRGRIRRYVMKIERVIGKRLPPNAVIHHRDKNPKNNDNKNLIVCENTAYHNLIHRRERAYYVCGNPNWRKCSYCQKHDDPNLMYQKTSSFIHMACATMHNYLKKTNELMNQTYWS